MTKAWECIFTFTKGYVSQIQKNRMINDFVELRSKLIKITNPLLESWNEEYTKTMNPSNDGFDPDYEEYIAKRFKPYIDKVNRSFLGLLSSVKIGISDEYCDIIGIDKKDSDQIISVTLKPME